MRLPARVLATFALTLVPVAALGETPAHYDLLPPTPAWSGESQELVADPDDPWATPCEVGHMEVSPDYDETVAFARRLAAASEQIEMVNLGRSPQGRDIWALIVSADGQFSPAALRASGKPLLLAQAGIHSGEIDGKDAGFMLLRDMCIRGKKSELLEGANLLFVPIFSVDAHERRSTTNRINQHGPEVQGWRTNARNLNLNRDYTKVETGEMQHMIRALREYEPDLYLDLHVTDGADYQYDATYGFTGPHGWSPAISTWLTEKYRPLVDRQLERMGHIPGPLIFAMDGRDISKGIFDWTPGPRYSTGYGDAAHIPSVLLENHSLKPYPQRVLGTYVFLEASMRALGQFGSSLRDAVREDRAARPERVHLGYETPDGGSTRTTMFKAITSRLEISPVSGRPEVQWTGRPYELEVPVNSNHVPTRFVRRPQAYYIPVEWAHLAERLEVHGIRTERMDAAFDLEVERYRLPNAKIADMPFEGRVRVDPGEPVVERTTVHFEPGAVRVPTDQELGTLAVLLLEPQHDDSLLQWGYLLEILQRTEYFENYMMEPLARRMMEDDPKLAAEFAQKLLDDPDFAADARGRLEWFYERSPFFDQQWKVYPIVRSLN